MVTHSTSMNTKNTFLTKAASLTSLIGGLAFMLIKFWGYTQTSSQAVFSDAMESVVNVVAACLALFVVFYAALPADEDHPYGHGKAEYFSAAFEGGLITFAGLVIMVEAISGVVQGKTLYNPQFGMLTVVGAGVGNLILGLFLLWVGKDRQSVALVASGKHLMSDFWTSVAVVVSLGLVWWTDINWFDSVIAILIGTLLAHEGFKLVRGSIGGLLDKEDLELLRELEGIFSPLATDGIIQIHHVKVIRSGSFHHIDAHLVLPEFWDIAKAHDRTDSFQEKVAFQYPYSEVEMNFHLDPCRHAYCSVCDLKNCLARVEEFKERMPVKLDHLRSKEEPKEYRVKGSSYPT